MGAKIKNFRCVYCGKSTEWFVIFVKSTSGALILLPACTHCPKTHPTPKTPAKKVE